MACFIENRTFAASLSFSLLFTIVYLSAHDFVVALLCPGQRRNRSHRLLACHVLFVRNLLT